VPALLATSTFVVGGWEETRKLLGMFPFQLSVGFGSMLLFAWLAAPVVAESCVNSLVDRP